MGEELKATEERKIESLNPNKNKFCYECKECAMDLDGKKRCKNPKSWCYTAQTVILPTDTACELFHISWDIEFKKPEPLVKTKGLV